MTSKGQAQDLKKSSSQALLGLLRSIAPDVIPEDERKLNEEDIKRVNERLIELLGKDAVEQQHLDKGARAELVNKDGLPIIEISEPVEDVDSLEAGITSIAQEDQLIPLASLPMTQRERLRQERERILDMLEEEERLEEQREKEQMLEEKKDLIRKKMEDAAKEKDRSAAAREMQKKMGRALLGGNSTDKEKNGAEIMAGKAVPSDSSKPKKSVSFAAEPAETTEQEKSPERETWGDISLARLCPMNRPTLLTKVEETKQPMKTKVVERKPVGQIPTVQQRPLDSDDESDPDDKEDGASLDDGQESPHAEQLPEDSASESDATNESLEDLDFAQHQREVALEYYAKRGIIGQAAAQALMSHSHTGEEDQKGTALDIGVTEPHSSKSPLSRFKASKLASSYNASIPSQLTSLEGSVLPASSAKTLQQTIRTGKLDSKNQLVGADSESEGEGENEAVQQVLELLGKGEVYNVGPEGNQAFYAVAPPKKAETDTAVALDTATLPPLTKPKTSKFKVDRSRAGPPKADQSQAKSISPTPTVSTTLPTTSTVVERRPPRVTKSVPPVGTSPTLSTIVNSPSFPPPRLPPTDKALQQSMIIDSPSFRPPQSSSTHSSMIVESPSFPQPSGAPRTEPDTSTPTNMQQTAEKRPTRPPAVMSSVVRERSNQPATGARPAELQPPNPQKVSRFLAERT
ncbi:hypothetical protein F5887DRAFT_1278690 [Amanita rubescens]|nr:hypothetical protein F5887DRAFT_1278690 [Amanita rubescens]